MVRPRFPLEAYFRNMELSQQRTQAVLRFAYGLPGSEQEDWFRERVAAVGRSSSRPVQDGNGQENASASRRVESSVLTDFESRLLEPFKLRTTAGESEPGPSVGAGADSPPGRG